MVVNKWLILNVNGLELVIQGKTMFQIQENSLDILALNLNMVIKIQKTSTIQYRIGGWCEKREPRIATITELVKVFKEFDYIQDITL